MADTVLTAEQVAARLAGPLQHWQASGAAILRRYRTPDWRATLMLVNAIGYAAEAAWHHPDLMISYAAVEVKLTTHDAGGVTARDFALAEHIEQLATARPPNQPKEAKALVL